MGESSCVAGKNSSSTHCVSSSRLRRTYIDLDRTYLVLDGYYHPINATVPSNMTHTLLTGCLHYPNGRGYNPLCHYFSTRSGRDDETGKARVDHNSSCKSNGLKA